MREDLIFRPQLDIKVGSVFLNTVDGGAWRVVKIADGMARAVPCPEGAC